MKKVMKLFLVSMVSAFMLFGVKAEAAKVDDTIYTGIYLDDISLGEMTKSQADKVIRKYVNELLATEISFKTADGTIVSTTPEDLGVEWVNKSIAKDAIAMCSNSNVIERYKVMKDIENDKIVYTPEFEVDDEKLEAFLTEISAYDIPAVDNSIIRIDSVFEYVEGKEGYHVDCEESTKMITDYLLAKEYSKQAVTLVVATDEPRGTKEELMKVKDVLGSYSSSYHTSNENRKMNIRRGTELANGTLVYPGEEFSSLSVIAPFSTSNGYSMASSYAGGKTVDGMGGGVCQFTSTLYDAALRAELEIVKRKNHSMLVGYVPLSADAAVADSNNLDFVFKNSTDYPIYIESWIENDSKVLVRIYGVETRPENRTIRFETEVIETIQPTGEVVYTDPKKPVGFVDLQIAHVGYKAKLWKIIEIDGVEKERVQVNSSSYRMTPRSVTVGTSTDNADYYNEIMAAAGTNSVDHVQQVVANINAQIVASAPVQ